MKSGLSVFSLVIFHSPRSRKRSIVLKAFSTWRPMRSGRKLQSMVHATTTGGYSTVLRHLSHNGGTVSKTPRGEMKQRRCLQGVAPRARPEFGANEALYTTRIQPSETICARASLKAPACPPVTSATKEYMRTKKVVPWYVTEPGSKRVH